MRSKSMKMMATAAAAAACTTSNQLYFTYRLGKSIYVPLTCRCNSRTLPQLRGDSFTLPVSVVEALYRVRDAEIAGPRTMKEEKKLWQRYKIDDESIINNKNVVVPQKLPPPPPLEAVACLPSLLQLPRHYEREPTIDDLYQEIQRQLIPQQQQQEQQSRDEERVKIRTSTTTTTKIIDSIVLSGEGEPTLRFDDMIELVRRIKSSFTETKMSPVHIRLTTNGLVQKETTATNNNSNNTNIRNIPQRLKDSGISHVSIGLMTWDAKQYNDLVRPVLPLTTTTNNLDNDDTTTIINTNTTSKAFDIVCDFIRDAVQVNGLEVETTAVERPDVDKVKTENFSKSLGVSKPIRWRPYFP